MIHMAEQTSAFLYGTVHLHVLQLLDSLALIKQLIGYLTQ